MTQVLPEQPAVLAELLPALADAPDDMQTAIGASLVRALDLAPRHPVPDWVTDDNTRESIARGLVEGYEEYCTRISKPTTPTADAA